MSQFNFGSHPNPQANTPAPRVEITVVPVADLTLRVDERVATYTLNGKTYTVLRAVYSSIPALVEQVKIMGTDENMNAWIEDDAFEAGIRVSF